MKVLSSRLMDVAVDRVNDHRKEPHPKRMRARRAGPPAPPRPARHHIGESLAEA